MDDWLVELRCAIRRECWDAARAACPEPRPTSAIPVYLSPAAIPNMNLALAQAWRAAARLATEEAEHYERLAERDAWREQWTADPFP